MASFLLSSITHYSRKFVLASGRALGRPGELDFCAVKNKKGATDSVKNSDSAGLDRQLERLPEAAEQRSSKKSR